MRVKNQTMTPAFRGLSLFCFLISMSFSQLSFSGVYGEGTWGTMTYESSASAEEVLVTSFIERFYTNILGRPSDAGGLEAWRNVINTQSASAVALGFLNSAEFKNKGLDDAAFVDILYRTLFDRAGDEGGTSYWLEQLSSGQLRDMVIWGFLRAGEFKTLSDSFGVTAVSSADESSYGVRAFTERFFVCFLGIFLYHNTRKLFTV